MLSHNLRYVKSKKARAHVIAQERITHLYERIKQEYKTHPQDQRRYAEVLRSLATKHNLRITEIKRTLCKNCNTYLVAGVTATVRVHAAHRTITCLRCLTVKRLGLGSTRKSDKSA